MASNIKPKAIAIFGAIILAMVPNISALADTSTVQSNTTSFYNPCAVFRENTSDNQIKRISYGEEVAMGFDYTTNVTSHGNDSTTFKLKIEGDGHGVTSNLNYELSAKATLVLSNEQLNSGNAEFDVDTRLTTTGVSSSEKIVNQDSGLKFKLHIAIDTFDPSNGPNLSYQSNSFQLKCTDETWQDLTAQKNHANSGGKGFGDPWNKYAWSMKDFNNKLYVGTKNAHYDYQNLQTPTEAVTSCETNLAASVPQIYLGLACLELYDSNLDDPNAGASARNAKIYSYNYRSKNWTEDSGTGNTQGFRVMEKHNGKLFAGSDLGSFIMGVDLGSKITEDGIDKWNFPGSRILVNSGDDNWSHVDCQPTTPGGHDKPCNASVDPIHSSVQGNINTSFRALASYGGSLYLGTFNYAGAELWKYVESDTEHPWTLVAKFDGVDYPRSSTISELKSFNGKLYIGLGFGPALSTSYLFEYDGVGAAHVVEGLPDANGGSSVFKLFASQSGELYVGLVDFTNGFNLHAFKPDRSQPWRTISETGFENASNVYVWSMAELNGIIYLGTFSTDMLNPDTLPRGSAELWSSDSQGITWNQQPTPLGFSPLNYGIRTMEVGDGHLYMGTASNMLAPDIIENFPNWPNIFGVGAGAQVWRLGDKETSSNNLGTITPASPTASLGLVTATSAEVNWATVPYADEYEVSLNGQKVSTENASQVTFTFRNLTSDTSYATQITAINQGVRSSGTEIRFRTNQIAVLKVNFDNITGILSKRSVTKITDLTKNLGLYKHLSITMTNPGIGVKNKHISATVAKVRLGKIASRLKKLGFTSNSDVDVQRTPILGKYFAPYATVTFEIRYN